GLQGPGRGNADAQGLRARQQCPWHHRRGGGPQILQRKSRRQSQDQRRGACVPALAALSRLSTGTLVVSDREVKLAGDALYDAAPAQIRNNLLKDFPQGWQVKADISVKPAAAPVDATVCQQLFSELLAKGKIRFVSGLSTLDPDSAGLLDHLIEITLRCPTVNIQVAGHTDADGPEGFNQALSEKRAEVGPDYLVKAGLPAS